MAGYTAQISGTEAGVMDPVPTFSACFGEAALPLHPSVYAELLAKKLKAHNTNAWLLNTGWTGGKYGVGKRMNLKITRQIIDAIHSKELEKIPTHKMPVFGFEVPIECPGIPPDILWPQNTWSNKDEYNKNLKQLANAFIQNFKKYEDLSSIEIKNAGPKIGA